MFGSYTQFAAIIYKWKYGFSKKITNRNVKIYNERKRRDDTYVLLVPILILSTVNKKYVTSKINKLPSMGL